MKSAARLTIVISVFCFFSCGKEEPEPDREVIPIKYFTNRILTSVEDGVWVEQTSNTYDSLLLYRNFPCLRPLTEVNRQYVKYNLEGQRIDSLAELPFEAYSSSTNYYETRLGEEVYTLKQVKTGVYDVVIFNENLKPATELTLDFTSRLAEGDSPFAPGKLQFIDAQTIALPILIVNNRDGKQRLAIAIIKNGILSDFAESEPSTNRIAGTTDVVVDKSGNVHLLTLREFTGTTRRQFSFFTYEKNTKKLIKTLDFEKAQFIPFKLLLSADQKGMYLLNIAPATVAADQIIFDYYNFETQSISAVNASFVSPNASTTLYLVSPISNEKEPLVHVSELAGGRTYQNGVYRINNEAKLELVFKQKSVNTALFVQKTPNGLIGIELDAITDGRNLSTYLLVHRSLSRVEPTLLSKGTSKTPSGCYYY